MNVRNVDMCLVFSVLIFVYFFYSDCVDVCEIGGPVTVSLFCFLEFRNRLDEERDDDKERRKQRVEEEQHAQDLRYRTL